MRQILCCGIGLVLAGCGASDGGVGPPPPPPVRVALAPTASGNDQVGPLATALSEPLRVVVDSAGTKRAGVTVSWHVSGDDIAPQSSVTNAAGIAAATWTIGTVAGIHFATVTVVGSLDTVTFSATAPPGPAAALQKTAGDKQTVGANAAFLSDLSVSVTDRYGNAIAGAAQGVTCTVEHGPVAFIEILSGDNTSPYSTARLRPLGSQGGAVVRAALSRIAQTVDFTLTVGPPHYAVFLRPLAPKTVFLSQQNATSAPAVDTIPAGQAVVWTLDPFDYYDIHSVVSVGMPSFPNTGNFPYRNPSTVSVTFSAPGTYHYADGANTDVTGIVVVQ